MKVPISWLNDYVDVSDLSVRELADKLTFSGVEVEGIEEVGVTLDDSFVVGEVLACAAHPNSDHLHVCKVADGTQEWQVVCGAPNARAGLKVAFAKIGAVVPEGGFAIKKAKLRGVESFGMLCSARELKLSEDHSGIMELDPALKTGTFLRDALPKPEVVLDLEITWNRPDCLSIIGIAREFAALLGRPLKLPDATFAESAEPVESFAKVIVEDPQKCPRYTARVMTGVKDGPSPDWMRRRLELCGVRAISLTVDVTNYVMLELGQPLHAFDYRKLAERTIVVRRAAPGEKMKTLDGAERTLSDSMLVIADARSPNAVAGVMGGADSEIALGTEHVLLESALFDPASTKWTSSALGLSSESSRRYERGVDPDLADFASRRAVSLLARHGQAQVARGVIDVDNRGYVPGEVALRFARANAVIGVALSPDAMVAILTSLGLAVVSRDAERAVFRIPSYRLDLTLEADLVEEIARMHGLDAIPDRMPGSALNDRPFYARARARQLLLGFGLSEAMHYSFLSAQELDAFDARDAARRVALPNPVSADYGVLRSSLLPQLAGSLGRNASRQVPAAALFEIGRVFSLGDGGAPREEERVALGTMGPFGRSAVDQRRALGNEEAMLWLKGVLENLASALRAGGLGFEPCEHPAMEAGWAVTVTLAKEPIGVLGLLSPKLRHQWRMTSPMPVAELRLAPLLEHVGALPKIKPVPQFPAIRRDIAFLSDAAVAHRDVVAAIRKAASAELTGVELFDIFQSKEIGRGRRSLAYALEFRSPDRTLTDQEVNTAFAKIVQALKSGLNVEVREG
ncbi:MAG: phenylalanine--tRNA ligase subunit beta [Verrucomicrobiota bacterium]|jgi:phenylalanyl-tRNA synthetase beta chain|nr:phenylalanine--tRNA ligase subunit beta [Verrucomicrobiota bacterium]